MIAGITSISQVNVAGTTIISTTPPTYKTGQNDFNTTPLYGGKSIWFNGKRSFEAGQYRLTYLGGVYTLYTFNVPINGLLWRWGNTVFPIADVQNISTTSDGAITVSAIPPGPYYFTSTSQSGFETANIGTTFEFYHPGGALGFCIGDTGVNFSDNVIGAIGGSSSYAGPHFRLDAVPSSGKAIIKIPNLLTQFNNSDHLQVGAVVTGANLATISPTSTVTVSSIDVSNDIVTLVQTNNVGLTNIISGSSLTQSNLSITFRMNSLSYDYLTSPGNISVVTTGSAIKNITSSSAIADSTKVSKALYTASSSQIYSTASSGTTSLDFYTLSSNVIPGLFVSCSGAITTTSNTYIKNIKKSNKSYESIVGWAYGGSNSFFYTDSSVVGSSNVIVGSAFDSDKQLFASDGIVSSISSLSLPQPTVICTWITTSALLPGNTEMAIKVSNSQINTTSTAGINVFNNLFNLWNNGAVPIYVSTGGDGINNNYKQSDGYHISVSSMVSTTSTIVLKKSNGATWTSALPSGNIGSTNNSVIIFTTVEPGTTVQDWYPYDDRVSYFGGGKSYSAGWYKVTYQGGAFNERSTFRANTGIRCNGASRDGNQPPLIIDYNNNIVTIESFHPGDGEKNIFYEFSYFQNNKYAYFWHPGGTIGICISDYLGWGDNGWGFPLPIITLSRPPFIELSSIANNTGYGKINFSNPVLTMLISSATTASISTGSTVNFYGHVIDLDKSNTGFTALTDTLEIE
jgi:hypothetical protein